MTQMIEYPYLEITKPDHGIDIFWFKQIFAEKPEQDQITIGRLEENDLTLSDPHKKISRQHCIIKNEFGHWWLVDKESANGTFLRRSGEEEKIDVRWEEKIALKDGDIILILANILNNDQPIFWQLIFRDPGETEKVVIESSSVEIVYSLNQEQLIRVKNFGNETIALSPQERSLIHYMALRNYNNQQKSVVCQYKELIKAIWGDDFGYNKNSITRLIWAIRHKIETDSGNPQFLQTVRGKGYRLNITIIKN